MWSLISSSYWLTYPVKGEEFLVVIYQSFHTPARLVDSKARSTHGLRLAITINFNLFHRSEATYDFDGVCIFTRCIDWSAPVYWALIAPWSRCTHTVSTSRSRRRKGGRHGVQIHWLHSPTYTRVTQQILCDCLSATLLDITNYEVDEWQYLRKARNAYLFINLTVTLFSVCCWLSKLSAKDHKKRESLDLFHIFFRPKLRKAKVKRFVKPIIS
jgi:hypothetical protein